MQAYQIANLIPDIVAARETSPTDRWLLLIIDKKIQCVPQEDSPCEGFPLMPITMQHVDKGIKGRDWDRIVHRIATYQRNFPDFYAEPVQVAETDPPDHKEPEKTEENETETTTDPE